MAHLWTRQCDGDWRRETLEGGVSLPTEGDAAPAARVRHAPFAGADAGAVLEVFDPRARINGEACPLPLRVLADGDEIRTPDGRLAYYSTESQASVIPLPAEAGEVCCARCRQPIDPGAAVVACPSCGTYHHQTEEFPCWTHIEKCALCDQPTALDAPFRFNPEAL